MKIHEDYYLVIDLEATCCDKLTVPRNKMEIIEIGAVLLPKDGSAIVDEFQTFVRPVRYPVLTPFCTELTSISQADVDAAPTYPEAIQAMTDWLYQFGSHRFCSWGAYDKNQFLQDCDYHDVAYPFASPHLNLKLAFSDALGVKKRFGMRRALEKCGLPLSGTHHRGIDDARNIAAIVQWVLAKNSKRREHPRKFV